MTEIKRNWETFKVGIYIVTITDETIEVRSKYQVSSALGNTYGRRGKFKKTWEEAEQAVLDFEYETYSQAKLKELLNKLNCLSQSFHFLGGFYDKNRKN